MGKPLITRIGHSDELPSDYYLGNFHSLARFVQYTYRDILTDAENAWYTRLCACSVSSQQLYIRLLTRKGSVFRLSKLRYPEIQSLARARENLVIERLADHEPPASLATLLAAYTKPELLDLLAINTKASVTRADLVESILCADDCIQSSYVRTLQDADQWITACGHQHWTVFTLCFFGNLYQDSSEFVLRDLGTVRYESYSIHNGTRAFSSRAQLDAHLKYFECDALYDTIDCRNRDHLIMLVDRLPELLPGDIHLSRRLDRFRNRVARQLEKLGHVDEALVLYDKSSHPPARERRARIFTKQGDLQQAQALVNAMTSKPFNEAERAVGMRLESNIRRAQGLKVKSAIRFRPNTTVLTLQPSDSRVERAARTFYSQIGHCFYTENALVNSVLGLFIWDIIFYPIKGVFFNPFQSAPSDFYETAFRHQRVELLDERFRELNDSETFAQRIMTTYCERAGLSNPLVRWGRLSEELLVIALQQVPAEHWRAMFERILQDPRENTSGFPDLVLFRDSGDYEFIEIKGPGDTLQQNQRRWMQCFSDNRIPCRVVNVRWALQNSTAPT